MAERLNLGDLIYRLGFESEDEFLRALERTLDKADDEARKRGKRAGRSFAQDFSEGFKSEFASVFAGATLGSALGTVLGQAFNQAMAATRQFVTDSNREFARYEQGLIQLKLAGEENLGAAAEQIRQISEASKVFSETDVSLTLGELVKAGFDVNTAMELTAKSTNLASAEINAATGEFLDLTDSARSVSDILAGLEYDVSQAGRVVDVLGKTSQDSKLSLSDLVPAIASVAGTAKGVGLEIEDLGATFAALKDRGIPAAEAANGLRSVINSLIEPPATAKAAFDKLGLTFIKADGTTRSYAEVVQNLNRVVAAGPRGVQLLAAGMDTFAVNTAIAMGRSAGAIQGFKEKLEDAEGSTKRLSDTLKDSAIGRMAEFEAQINNAKRALGEQLQPTLVVFYRDIAPKVVEGINSIIDAINRLIAAQGKAAGGAEDWARTYGVTLTDQQKQVVERILTDIKAAEAKQQLLARQLESPLLVGNALSIVKAAIAAEQAKIDALKTELRKIQKEAAQNNPPPRKEEQVESLPFLVGERPPPSDFSSGKQAEDAIVKQARELEGQLRVLQERYKLGRIDAAQYRAELERLQRQLQALEKSAATTERKQAVLGGLSGVKDALEALEKARLQPRLEALGTELERQNRLFGDTKNVSQYAGALADLQQKAEALKRQTTSAEVKKQIDELLGRIAEGRKKLEDTLTQIGEEAAVEIGAAAADRLQQVYGDGFQAALSAIRRSFPDFNAALSGLLKQGFSEEDARELAARAFPQNFLELAFANLDKTVDPEATGFADMGAKLGEGAGKAFTTSFADVVKNQRRLEFADRVFSFDELKAFSDQELLELRDLLKEIGLEGSAALEQVNAELAFRDPALAVKIEEEKALAEAYYQVQEGAEAAARGIEEYRQFLEALSLGGILTEIDRLQSALARGFDRPEEAEAARQQLDAATKALLANLDAQREGVAQGTVSEEAFAASLQAVIGFLKRKTEGLDASSAAALSLRNQIAALEEELRRLGLIETPLTSGEFSDGLKTFDERARDALDALDLLRREYDAGLISQEEYARGLQETIQYLELLAAEEGTTAEQARLLAIRIAQLKKELGELAKAAKRDKPETTPRQELEEVERKIKEVEAQIAAAEQQKLHFKVDSEEFKKAETNIQHLQARLAKLKQEQVELAVRVDIEENLPKIMLNGAKALIDGIQNGDLEGAFRKVFENVTDYFEGLLLQAILGPIAQQLAASVAQALAPLIASNPLVGLGILAGLIGLNFLFNRPKAADQKAADRASSRSGVSTLNVNVSSTFDITIASAISDPATRAAIERLVSQIVDRQLEIAMRRAGLVTR